MKKLLVILGVLFIAGCSNKQSHKTDLAELGLKGKVKSVYEKSYKAIEQFGKVKKGERKTEDSKELINQTFNKRGNLITEDHRKADNSLIFSKIYYYNNQERKKKIIRKNSNNEIMFSSSFVYDNEGNNIQHIIYNTDGEIATKNIFVYDSEGRPIEKSMYTEKGLGLRTEYEYKKLNHSETEKSRILKIYFGQKLVKEVESFYGYDNSLKLKYINKFTKDHKVIHYRYTYNDNKDIIKEEKWNISPTRDSNEYIINYDYDYDGEGNWIKRIEYKNGNPTFIIERNIYYY